MGADGNVIRGEIPVVDVFKQAHRNLELPLGWKRILQIVLDFDVRFVDLFNNMIFKPLRHLLVDQMKDRRPFALSLDNGKAAGLQFIYKPGQGIQGFLAGKLRLIPLLCPEVDNRNELFDIHVRFTGPNRVGAEQVVQTELGVLRQSELIEEVLLFVALVGSERWYHAYPVTDRYLVS